MKSLKDCYELNNGVQIPCVGFGTWQTPNGDVAVKAVKDALALGYRHIDTAAGYGNEESVGLAVKESGTGLVFEVPEMQSLSEKYGKTVAQVCIRWSLQLGFLPLPKSVTASRIKENSEVFDFELTDQDVKFIADLKDICGLSKDPDKVQF